MIISSPAYSLPGGFSPLTLHAATHSDILEYCTFQHTQKNRSVMLGTTGMCNIRLNDTMQLLQLYSNHTLTMSNTNNITKCAKRVSYQSFSDSLSYSSLSPILPSSSNLLYLSNSEGSYCGMTTTSHLSSILVCPEGTSERVTGG